VLNEFDSLPSAEAQRRLYSCFASRKWAHQVARGRPYADLPALFEAAERAWSELEPSDWTAALAGHPRIGEGGGSSPRASEREQKGVREASVDVQSKLAEANRAYEARFGHVFLIAAAAKSADEILAALRRRMDNDPVTEAQVAAAEHRKIARRRLERMLAG
jgi:OHCU decarboxylase